MRWIRRRTLFRHGVLGAGAASALAVLGCGSDAPSTSGSSRTAQPQPAGAATTAPAGPPSGSVTVGLPSLGDESLDISHFNVGNHLHQMLLVNDTLVQRGPDGKLGPALATKWRSDETGWEFDLNPAARFHNGDPVTADDVVFYVERVMDFPKAWAGPDLRPVIKSVEAIDEHKVRFNTSKPFPLLLYLAWSIGPMPRKHFKQMGEERALANYVGSGPYRIKGQAKGQSMTFEAVADFYNPARRPRVRDLTLRVMPEASTRLAALRTGEVDIADLDFSQIKQVKGSQDVSLVQSPSARAMHLIPFGLDSASPSGPLKDQRVREALLVALDRKAIIDQLFGGAGDPMITGFLPSTPGYRTDLKPHPNDPARAKQLLSAAGFGNGFEITLHSGGASTAPDDELPVLASYWQKVGITTKISVKESLVYLEAVRKRELTGVGTLAYSAGVSGIDGVKLWNAYYGCGIDYNGANWCNQDADGIIARAQTEIDESKRIALLQQANKLIYDELPNIPRYYLSGVFGTGRKVKKLEFPSGWVYYGGYPLETVELKA